MSRWGKRPALAVVPALVLVCAERVAAAPYVDDMVLLELAPGSDIQEVCDRWSCELVDSILPRNLYAVRADYPPDDLLQYCDVMEAEDDDILTAEPNYIQETPEGSRQLVVIAVGGDFVDFEDQEITERIGLDEAHAAGSGSGVRVGVLDSGVDPTHEAFSQRLSSLGYDFIDHDSQPWETANGVDDDGDLAVDEGFGHGSMVAGIVGLTAPGAEIVPIRVLDDEGYGTAWNVALGLEYALDAGVHILNLSFGTTQESELLAAIIEDAIDHNVTVVAAAGNESREEPSYFPARLPRVIMVTAVDSTDVKADFSDWNDVVAVSAPGTGVRSVFPGGQWALGSGCSFAAPFITGEAALLRSNDPTLIPGEIRSRIRGGVESIYQLPGNEAFVAKLGTGRVYVPQAMFGVVGVPGQGTGRSGLLAYPNPSRGPIVFRIGDHGSREIAVSIYDVGGRLVQQIRASGGEARWTGTRPDGSAVPRGVYYARVSAAETLRIQLID